MVMELNRFEDESTTECFKFVIRCEHCGKIVKTYQSTSAACYKPKLFSLPSARRAKELLWLRAHDEARENATQEALNELNRCESCGTFVCDECSVFAEKLDGGVACKKCAEKL